MHEDEWVSSYAQRMKVDLWQQIILAFAFTMTDFFFFFNLGLAKTGILRPLF